MYQVKYFKDATDSVSFVAGQTSEIAFSSWTFKSVAGLPYIQKIGDFNVAACRDLDGAERFDVVDDSGNTLRSFQYCAPAGYEADDKWWHAVAV